MLQRDSGLTKAHSAQGVLAQERAMERFSQHPQLNGNGKQRKRAGMELEGSGRPEAHSVPMSRLVGHGHKPRKSRKSKKSESDSDSDESSEIGEMEIKQHEALHKMRGGRGGQYGRHRPDDYMSAEEWEHGYEGGGLHFESTSDAFERAKRINAKKLAKQAVPVAGGALPGSDDGIVIRHSGRGSLVDDFHGAVQHHTSRHPAQDQGEMLAKFLERKHGRGHARHFIHGMLHGGNWIDDIKHAFSDEVWNPKKNGVADAFNKFGQNVKKEFVDPNSTLRSKVIPVLANVGSTLASGIPGVGPALSTGIRIAGKVNDVARSMGKGRPRGRPRKMVGCGQPEGVSEALGSPSNGGDPTGAVDVGRSANPPRAFERNSVGMGRPKMGQYFQGGAGATPHSVGAEAPLRHRVPSNPGGEYVGGRKKRSPAGEGDARKRRGAEVSRLMREKGMTLGQASKHIKEHGY